MYVRLLPFDRRRVKHQVALQDDGMQLWQPAALHVQQHSRVGWYDDAVTLHGGWPAAPGAAAGPQVHILVGNIAIRKADWELHEERQGLWGLGSRRACCAPARTSNVQLRLGEATVPPLQSKTQRGC